VLEYFNFTSHGASEMEKYFSGPAYQTAVCGRRRKPVEYI